MLQHIVRRLLSSAFLVLVISFITFLMLNMSSGTIARRILGRTATQDQVAAKATELGLDQPVFGRYLEWLTHAVTGDLGTSWFTHESVLSGLAYRLPVTLSIALGATIVTAILSVIFGMLAAIRGGWLDRTVQFSSIFSFGIPSFLVGLVLAVVFAVQLGWFPATGYIPPTVSFTGWMATTFLPITALAIGSIAATVQQVRGSTLDLLQQDYVRTLRSRGISEWSIQFKYVLRNAAPAALTVLSLQFIGLLGGAVIIEQIFAIPGIGAYAVKSSLQGDVPVVMGTVILTVIVVIIVNLVIDLANSWLNPKAVRS